MKSSKEATPARPTMVEIAIIAWGHLPEALTHTAKSRG